MAKHRTARQWASILDLYRRSELSQAEFCRRRGLALSTFGFHLRRAGCGEGLPEGNPVTGGGPRLMEVALQAASPLGRTPPASGVLIEIESGHKHRVRIHCQGDQTGEILRQIYALCTP
jgi:hypothetical protein